MTWFRRAVALWLPAAAATTVLAGVVYGGVQQAHRTQANDPQIQMAQDAAAELNTGVAPSQVVIGRTVDIATSLAPWLVVYGSDGSAVAGTGSFEGHAPVPPSGLLADTAAAGERRITWEPRDGVRQAIVSVPFEGGVVIAGRSLYEVEKREDRLVLIVGAGWLAALMAAGVGAILGALLMARGTAPQAGEVAAAD